MNKLSYLGIVKSNKLDCLGSIPGMNKGFLFHMTSIMDFHSIALLFDRYGGLTLVVRKSQYKLATHLTV